jgi:hypothetical protein
MSVPRLTCLIVLLVFSHLIPAASMAQSRSEADRRSTLRARFIAAFSKDFDLIRDQLTTRSIGRGGGTFWLAFVKAKRTGYFALQYRYREGRPKDIWEHEIHFSIGPQGCRRGTPDSGVYGRFCLGDTIIIPVRVNNYSGHVFKLARAEYADGKEEPANSNFDTKDGDTSAVANPAAPILRYISRSAHRLYHIIPGYTLTLSALFEAQEPGRMNLLMIAEGESITGIRRVDGLPIIVLPRDMPATLIAGHEEERSYIQERDGHERLFSSSSNRYMINVLVLQPGDRIQVGYFSIVRGSDYVAGRFGETGPDPSQHLKPVISVRPFAPDVEYGFTEWIVDYLPQPKG